MRADADYDGGITGLMKIAHAAEGFGLDCEIHAPGPAHRHCMAALRNTNYYELGLVHPQIQRKTRQSTREDTRMSLTPWTHGDTCRCHRDQGWGLRLIGTGSRRTRWVPKRIPKELPVRV